MRCSRSIKAATTSAKIRSCAGEHAPATGNSAIRRWSSTSRDRQLKNHCATQDNIEEPSARSTFRGLPAPRSSAAHRDTICRCPEERIRAFARMEERSRTNERSRRPPDRDECAVNTRNPISSWRRSLGCLWQPALRSSRNGMLPAVAPQSRRSAPFSYEDGGADIARPVDEKVGDRRELRRPAASVRPRPHCDGLTILLLWIAEGRARPTAVLGDISLLGRSPGTHRPFAFPSVGRRRRLLRARGLRAFYILVRRSSRRCRSCAGASRATRAVEAAIDRLCPACPPWPPLSPGTPQVLLACTIVTAISSACAQVVGVVHAGIISSRGRHRL